MAIKTFFLFFSLPLLQILLGNTGKQTSVRSAVRAVLAVSSYEQLKPLSQLCCRFKTENGNFSAQFDALQTFLSLCIKIIRLFSVTICLFSHPTWSGLFHVVPDLYEFAAKIRGTVCDICDHVFMML